MTHYLITEAAEGFRVTELIATFADRARAEAYVASLELPSRAAKAAVAAFRRTGEPVTAAQIAEEDPGLPPVEQLTPVLDELAEGGELKAHDDKALKPLTPKQAKTFFAIRDFLKRGVQPTVAQLIDASGPSGASHVADLKRWGYVDRGGSNGGLRVLIDGDPVVSEFNRSTGLRNEPPAAEEVDPDDLSRRPREVLLALVKLYDGAAPVDFAAILGKTTIDRDGLSFALNRLRELGLAEVGERYATPTDAGATLVKKITEEGERT